MMNTFNHFSLKSLNYRKIYYLGSIITLFLIIVHSTLSITNIEFNLTKNFHNYLLPFFASWNIYFLLKDKLNEKLLFSLIFIILGVIVLLLSGSKLILKFSCICLMLANLDYKKIIKIHFWTSLFVLVLTLSMYFCSFIDIEPISLRGGKIRNTFGYIHPNFLGSIIFSLIMSYWVIYRSKISDLITILLLFFAYLFLNNFVDSRTNEYLCLIGMVTVAYTLISKELFSNFFKYIDKYLLYYAIFFGFLFLFLLCIYISYNYNPTVEFYSWIDKLLSGRVRLSYEGLIKYGMSIWGQKTSIVDIPIPGSGAFALTKYEFFDSLYINIPIKHGLVSLAIYFICYMIIIKNCYFKLDYRIAFVLCLFLIHGISERHFIFINFNIFIFLVFTNLVCKKIFAQPPKLSK